MARDVRWALAYNVITFDYPYMGSFEALLFCLNVIPVAGDVLANTRRSVFWRLRFEIFGNRDVSLYVTSTFLVAALKSIREVT